MENNNSIITAEAIDRLRNDLQLESSRIGSLFVRTTNTFPLSLRYNNVDFKLFEGKIMDCFSNLLNDDIINQDYNKKKDEYSTTYRMFVLNENIFLIIESDCSFVSELDSISLNILYNHQSDVEVLESVKRFAESSIKRQDTEGKIFLMMTDDDGDFMLRDFELKRNQLDINKNYNDDFPFFHDKAVNRLNNPNDKGILLMYGLSGTGKTTYLRYLTHRVHKRFIYITPELACQLASPDFIRFLMSYPNSILVIEDAETVIGNRKVNSLPVITNLLNLSDGILSDCLNIQIVCTFNMKLSMIDKAFLRKGRLIDLYYFDKLNESKAQDLMIELGHVDAKSQAMTLAEIYNYSGPKNVEAVNNESAKIGFRR